MLRETMTLAAKALIAAGVAFGIVLYSKDSLDNGNRTDLMTWVQSVLPGGDTAAPSDVARGYEGRTDMVALRAGPNKHFSAAAMIEGSHVNVLVDTGASMVALTHEDALKIGFDSRKLEFQCCVNTANGRTEVAPVTLKSVSIGPVTVRNVRAAVMEKGKLSKTLLGMSYLGELSRFEMKGNQLVLYR
ncbi:MAG: TIGR02281 family clan AA aspartic protease [Pseudomonadota bacterium]